MGIPARLGIVTLGVSDLDRSVAFYTALGWERCESSIEGTIVWFRTADTNLGLFPYDELAEDATLGKVQRGSFGGITLAINVQSAEDVGRFLQEAKEAGAGVVKPATKDLLFGHGGYFADPDGYLWEIAHNPGFPIGDDGRLTIP
jgi:Predicted lactoylglutathione lyase